MYAKAAKEYLKTIKPSLEEAGKTKKDLPIPNFECRFDASLDCTIKDGVFEMVVDYTGASVISFELLDEPKNGSYLPYSIGDLAQEIDESLCCLKEEYGF